MAREQVGTAPARPDDTATIGWVQHQLTVIPGVSQIFGEIPTGTKDGVTTSFTLVNPFKPNTTVVFRNGLRETSGIHYFEISPATIMFDTPPLSDDDLSVDYVVGQVGDQ